MIHISRNINQKGFLNIQVFSRLRMSELMNNAYLQAGYLLLKMADSWPATCSNSKWRMAFSFLKLMNCWTQCFHECHEGMCTFLIYSLFSTVYSSSWKHCAASEVHRPKEEHYLLFWVRFRWEMNYVNLIQLGLTMRLNFNWSSFNTSTHRPSDFHKIQAGSFYEII